MIAPPLPYLYEKNEFRNTIQEYSSSKQFLCALTANPSFTTTSSTMNVLLCLFGLRLISDLNQWIPCVPGASSDDEVCACRVDWPTVNRCTTAARCKVNRLLRLISHYQSPTTSPYFLPVCVKVQPKNITKSSNLKSLL